MLCGEVPRSRAVDVRPLNGVCVQPRRTDGIFGGIVSGLVGGVALRRLDWPQQILEQVEDVRTEVAEVAAARDLRIEPPGSLAITILRRRWTVEHRVYAAYLADSTRIEPRFDLEEAWQHPPVVRDEQRHARLFARDDHRLTFRISARHRLFDVHRFPGLGDRQHVVLVRRRRRGNVNGIHIRVVDQRISVIVPLGDAVTLRVVTRQVAVSPHHCD